MRINTEKRRLSLAGTFVVKFFFPSVVCSWILFKLTPWRLQGIGDFSFKDLILIPWLALAIKYVRIKTVEVDDTHIYISNYFERISVPCTALQEIKRSIWANDPITLFFSIDTPFGRKITFMPRADYKVVIAELEARRKAATD